MADISSALGNYLREIENNRFTARPLPLIFSSRSCLISSWKSLEEEGRALILLHLMCRGTCDMHTAGHTLKLCLDCIWKLRAWGSAQCASYANALTQQTLHFGQNKCATMPSRVLVNGWSRTCQFLPRVPGVAMAMLFPCKTRRVYHGSVPRSSAELCTFAAYSVPTL